MEQDLTYLPIFEGTAQLFVQQELFKFVLYSAEISKRIMIPEEP